jgi:hypothetical protein
MQYKCKTVMAGSLPNQQVALLEDAEHPGNRIRVTIEWEQNQQPAFLFASGTTYNLEPNQ